MAKQMNQIVSEYSDLYDGTSVSSEDQELLNDYFYYREVCSEDDDKFIHFYRRNLKMFYSKYLLKLEAELTEMPELIDHYEAIHNVLTNTGTVTNSGSTHDTGESSDTASNTHSGTNSSHTVTDDDRSHSGSNSSHTVTDDDRSHSGTNSGSDTTEQLTDGKHSDIRTSLPQGVAYSGVTGSNFGVETLDLTYATEQNQSADNSGKVKSDKSGTDSSTDNADIDTSVTGTDNSTDNADIDTTVSGTDSATDGHTGSAEHTNTITTSGTVTNNLSNESDMMRSGSNVAEAELRRQIYDFAGDANAFRWLVNQLRVCFNIVYVRG